MVESWLLPRNAVTSVGVTVPRAVTRTAAVFIKPPVSRHAAVTVGASNTGLTSALPGVRVAESAATWVDWADRVARTGCAGESDRTRELRVNISVANTSELPHQLYFIIALVTSDKSEVCYVVSVLWADAAKTNSEGLPRLAVWRLVDMTDWFFFFISSLCKKECCRMLGRMEGQQWGKTWRHSSTVCNYSHTLKPRMQLKQELQRLLLRSGLEVCFVSHQGLRKVLEQNPLIKEINVL